MQKSKKCTKMLHAKPAPHKKATDKKLDDFNGNF